MASPPTDRTGPGDAAEHLNANAWVDCACGQRHWGRYGAAGLLLVYRPTAGPAQVLLQHRAAWTHQGGTWALPGGARGHDETPQQAATREAHEEAGLDPASVTTGELVVVDHGPWSYTYVIASVGDRPDLVPTDQETEDLAWVALDEVAAYPLHPLFAQAWPGLQARAARAAGAVRGS
jgi:8-oxo-dGTP pyrophosphatase MutT (NUDIX family)